MALPAGVAAAVGLGATPAATFRADAVGWAACVAVAAFAPAGPVALLVPLLCGPLLLAVAHAALGGTASGAFLLGAVCVGCACATAGLRALGRGIGCPEPAAGGVAALVLALAGSGVWWVDRVAEVLPASARVALRRAVVRADPVTAIAYDVAGYERLHAQDLYEGTVVASSPVALPDANEVAGAYGGVGALALLLAGRLRRPRRGAPPHGGTP